MSIFDFVGSSGSGLVEPVAPKRASGWLDYTEGLPPTLDPLRDLGRRHAEQPGTKKMAVAMVLTIPMGLISLIAAHLFVRFARSAKGSGMK